LYNKAAASKPTKPAPPSELIIPVKVAITSPGRNAAPEPKITCTTTASAIAATPASVNFLPDYKKAKKWLNKNGYKLRNL
jgi:hypothetical protein